MTEAVVLQQTLEGLYVAVAVLDEDRRIVGANTHLAKLLGYDPAELYRMTDESFLPETEQAGERQAFGALLSGHVSRYRRAVRCRRRDGTILSATTGVSRIEHGAGGFALRTISPQGWHESERCLWAAELHDVVAQPLATLYCQLQAWQRQPPDAETVEKTTDLVRDLLSEQGMLLANLRSPRQDLLGLLRRAIRDFERVTALPVEMELDVGAVGGVTGLFAGRIVQESLTNVRKHARASRVAVRVWQRSERLAGEVVDDGCGFSSKNGDGFGLEGMEARARFLGGSLHVDSELGRGTRVRFELPV
ncbi:MAG TPA: ATP-binding protein [Candidatus Xenobia bacterium]